jgi:hypothetical protein
VSQDAVPFLPRDIVHIKLPNPADPLEGLGYGLSPISSLARVADVDNRVTSFLNDFFRRGTMMTMALKFKVPLDDDQINRIRGRWKDIYGGSDNWSEIGIFDEDGSIERLGMTFEEMGFEAIDERNESRILGPFGVPPILIGTRTGLARSTYSNYEEARKAFWEDTLVPELSLQESEYQFAINDENQGLFVQFDYSNVPALQQNMLEQVEAATKLWAMGVPVNQALDSVGLAIGRVPGGNIGYLPNTVSPVLGGLPAPLPSPAEPDDAALLAPDGTPLPDQADFGRMAEEAAAAAEEDKGGQRGGVTPFRSPRHQRRVRRAEAPHRLAD